MGAEIPLSLQDLEATHEFSQRGTIPSTEFTGDTNFLRALSHCILPTTPLWNDKISLSFFFSFFHMNPIFNLNFNFVSEN